VDLLFVSATLHHLPNPAAYLADARRHLRPGAKVAILESRQEGLLAASLGRHGTSPKRLMRTMGEAGYRLRQTHDVVRGHFFGIFEVA
jgi:ubiquinone/menaquinone biosynthesis C-methylase UbiE